MKPIVKSIRKTPLLLLKQGPVDLNKHLLK
ncbi:hypothetical protein M140OLGA_2076 [Staphylococcus aureus subsp. aureus 112808A]|nr:hypothetical protein M140OLGA_2076 [Staphylococcus aureus subsp. aureus 112808A]